MEKIINAPAFNFWYVFIEVFGWFEIPNAEE
jgi:hypothetical protein